MPAPPKWRRLQILEDGLPADEYRNLVALSDDFQHHPVVGLRFIALGFVPRVLDPLRGESSECSCRKASLAQHDLGGRDLDLVAHGDAALRVVSDSLQVETEAVFAAEM